MVKQVIDVGTSASDGTGDPLRDAFTKINDNFTELYSTVENEGLTYGNIASNVTGITFNVTRYAESYAATPVLRGTGQVVGNVYVIRGNVLGGTTPLNDVLLTVTTLANATVGNIATVSTVGVPIAPVLRVNGLTGNVNLTVNNITGAASKGYVDNSIAANLANVTTTITNSLNANITAANAVISNHAGRITTLESNSAAQATQINNLVSVKANVSYVDTSIGLALSSNAILANVASVNANVAAANAEILTRASLNGANFSGNVEANFLKSRTSVRAQTYFVAGSETDQGLGQTWANPAALFFGNSSGTAEKFYQVNLQNVDPTGSGDFVVTADDGNDASNFVAFGIAGSQSIEPEYPSQKPHDGYVFIRGGDLDIQSETGNVELIAGNLAVGQVILTSGNIVKFGPDVRLQFADGTLQSTAFGGNTNVASINANVTAANVNIAALQANAAAQALDLNSLLSNAAAQGSALNSLTTNAASQAVAINSVNANIGAYQTFANANAATQATSLNSINANVTAANINITSLLSNAASQAQELDNLTSNAQSQQGDITALQSNSATQGTQINLLNANLLAANTNISSLTSNSAAQGTQINLLNANVVAANINITNLQTNAATQALQLDNLQTNVNSWYNTVDSVEANIGAFQTYANANAATQATAINTVNANLGSFQSYANSTFSTSSYGNTQVAAYLPTYNGNISAGNVAAGYFVGNINASTVSTGNLSITGNTTQTSASYETYSNITNSGGNITCNFVNSATFYANLTANVTANFTNVVAAAGTITGVTVIVDQGATPYGISNIQINGGSVQTVKWAGGTTNVGTANNTDVMSFSLINLGGGAYKILGAISNYG